MQPTLRRYIELSAEFAENPAVDQRFIDRMMLDYLALEGNKEMLTSFEDESGLTST